MKLQLKSSVNRLADEPLSSKEGSERRGGHGTEHPCWRYFTRDRKSADCRMCGTHVAYACSGNLMRHLRSRHISESVVTQKEWEEIQKVCFFAFSNVEVCKLVNSRTFVLSNQENINLRFLFAKCFENFSVTVNLCDYQNSKFCNIFNLLLQNILTLHILVDNALSEWQYF